MIFLQLFVGFLRAGLLGYGGGPSAIPLVQKEAVEKYKWMTDDEFGDMLAIANALPGPIATKMAGYIGYRKAGWLGVLVAEIATVIPTVLLMMILLLTLSSFENKPWVRGMTHAVVPVVGVMLATMTWQFFSKSQKELGWVKSMAFVAGSFLLIQVLNIHPAIVIAVTLVFVLVWPVRSEKSEIVEQGRKAQ
jgi:chromate transporter